MRTKPFTRRVRLGNQALAALQSQESAIVVTSESKQFPSYSNGLVVIASDNRDRTCRCQVVDHRRYGTLEGLMLEENAQALANTPPAVLPNDHVYVVLELVTLESITALALAKHIA